MTASTDVRTADGLLRELFEGETRAHDPYPLYRRIREAATAESCGSADVPRGRTRFASRMARCTKRGH